MTDTARNYEKFRYFSVAIPLQSPVLERLEEDMKNSGTRYLSQMIANRVADYYALLDRLSNMVNQPSMEPEPERTESGADELLAAYERYEA